MLLNTRLLFAALSGAIASQLSSTGLSVTFNSIDYFISPYAAGNLTFGSAALANIPKVYGFAPVSVVQDEISVSDLPALISNWTKADDVFQPAFLGAVFIAGAAATTMTSPEGGSFSILPLDSTVIASGPYFLDTATGSLFPVYRLYDDFGGAFTQSLLQKPDGSFQTLSAQTNTLTTLTIGVPSRLYYAPSAEKPLAGVRVGVKDIFDLAGVKTSNGNRAWYHLYPPANATGTAMQRLIDAGAVIVGHQKPSQFANGEQATADWVSMLEPWNPRGDSLQDTSSSSSGAGASIASYEWLDIAVGSDTGGSIRGPAAAQGLFGNRPSHDLVSLDHAMPLSPALDTVGYEVRDPYLWDTANRVLYSSNYTSFVGQAPQYPKKIYTYNFPTNATANAAAGILTTFANQLAQYLGGNVSAVNLTSAWASNTPAAAGNNSLTSWLNITYPTLIAQDQTRLVRDPFYSDYGAVHNNRTPFVDPAPLTRWAFGDSLPLSASDQAIQNKTVFMNWFNTEILPASPNPLQCSDAFFLYPGSTGSQNPRNKYISPPSVPFGFSAGRISVFSEAPDFVFPLGQISAHSNVTKHDEFFPVTVDIMAAKGCDGLLVKLAQDLAEAGIVKVPQVGSSIYGGEILFKRADEVHVQ